MQVRFVGSILVAFLLPALLASTKIYAQATELGLGVGAFNYKGDIAPQMKVRFFRPAASAFFRYNTGKALSFRTEGAIGQITANDKYSSDPFQRERNLSFKSRIIEAALLTEYNFFDYQNTRKAINWTPYVFGGLGYTFFSTQPKTADFRNSGIVIPFGVGIKYEISRPWSVGIEFGARKTFTDYLDNIGPDTQPTQLGNGDPSIKDMYGYARLSISYTFYRIVCPK